MFVIINIEDLKVIYCCWVLKMFYDYVESGSYIESIFCENIIDFVWLKLCQKVVVDMMGCIIEIIMVGEKVVMFVGLVFVGLIGM